MTYSSPAQIRAGWRPTVSGGALATVAAALAVGTGIALTNAEAVISRGFAAALEETSSSTGTQARSAAPLVAGSEEYWLTRARKVHGTGGRVEPAAWSAPPTPFGVSVGDRITVASGGKERILEVVAVVEAPAEVTRIETGVAPQRQMIVTCRDMSAGNGGLVRFLTDPESIPASGARPVRTL